METRPIIRVNFNTIILREFIDLDEKIYTKHIIYTSCTDFISHMAQGTAKTSPNPLESIVSILRTSSGNYQINCPTLSLP